MSSLEPNAVGSAIQALAGAFNAVRLYPPTSDLPQKAIERFVSAAESATGDKGFLRVVVEPSHFRWGDVSIGQGNPQMETLAQALYSHQVGQLVIGPGLSGEEADAFIKAVMRDKAQVKDEGGLSKVLVGLGVSNIAVVEMSVRVSQEEGLRGIDLLSAPLDEIGNEVAAAAERWAAKAPSGEAVDEATEAVADLAMATRDIAASRIADALLRLDEATRTRVLANARTRDPGGRPMQGLLSIIGKMSPAALSRLLVLTAQQTGEDPKSILPELDLPPETMRLLQMMLSPSPQPESARGVPPEADHLGMAQELAKVEPEAEAELEHLIATARPSLAAGRALATACFVALSHPDKDSVEALAEAMERALKSGALGQVADAVDVMDELATQRGLEAEVAAARARIADPELISNLVDAWDDSVPPEALMKVVSVAGDAGFEALVTRWILADQSTRDSLESMFPTMADRLLQAAGRITRSRDPRLSVGAVSLMATLGDSRAVPALEQMLQQDDPRLRASAVEALARIGGPASARALSKALEHSDEDTRVAAAQAIGRHRLTEALPGLLKAVENYHLVERDATFKTEVIRSIVALQAREAVPALKRVVTRGWAFGHGNKVVRDVARQAISTLETQV
ncbi:MAG: hypothetical protein Kow0056_08920 [Coriobacteriia bacterium]